MATMRLRCFHSCMVLTVVGLLLVYSAFLTSPSYLDSNGLDGETTGSSNGNTIRVLGHNNSIVKVNGTLTGVARVGGGTGATKDTLLQQQPKFNQQPLTATAGAGNEGAADQSQQQNQKENTKRDVSQLSSQSTDGGSGKGALSPNEAGSFTTKKLKPTGTPAPPRVPGTVLTRDIYEAGFLYPNPGICPNDGQDTRLLILIASAPNHFSARDAIRLTWGHYAQRLDVNYAFIIGKTEQEATLDGIESEKHLYDDLIVANFEDSYDNLTLKTMSTMEWIDSYCNQSDFVLKTDDDMFINVPNLLSFIEKIEDEDKKEPKLYGRLARKWKPVRNKKSKYYISFQQYKKTVYPDFTTGPAYLFRARLARPLFDKGMEKTYLKLEDVYTTGIVAQDLKIKRINIGDFANKKVNLHKTGFCSLSKLISLHMVAYHEQFELWKKMLDGRTKCKIIYSSKNNNNNNNNNNHSNTNSSANPNTNNSNLTSDSSKNTSSSNTVSNNNSSNKNSDGNKVATSAAGGDPTMKLSPTTNSAKKKK